MFFKREMHKHALYARYVKLCDLFAKNVDSNQRKNCFNFAKLYATVMSHHVRKL